MLFGGPHDKTAGDGNPDREEYRYMSLENFAKLDENMKTSPLFLIIGAFLGMGIGFYNLIITVQNLEKKNDDDEEDQDNKWKSKN